jgi:hypothetical protein
VMSEGMAAKINAALDADVNADGIDGEESYHRELAVKVFRGMVDRIIAGQSATAKTKDGRRDG